MHVVVIGSGIAGLSAAWRLAGEAQVTLLEREVLPASHASGRNAAIFRQLEGGAGSVALARRSAALLDPLIEGWKRPTAALYLSRAAGAVEALAALGRASGVPHRLMAPGEAAGRVPALAGGRGEHALEVPGDGVMDIHAVTTGLARAAGRLGARLRVAAEVSRIAVDAGRVRGVELSTGEAIAADAVVNAGGAWAEGLGAGCDAPLPLDPRRRHLVLLNPDAPVDPNEPVAWRVDEQVYVRPESGGVLASPCDEVSWPAGVPPTDPEQLARLGEQLGAFAPGLVSARVRRAWACLRTFAPDREVVVGPDPRVEGLYWIAGLGGRGMSVGVAVGELLADTVLGRPNALAEAFSPARLVRREARSAR